MNATNLFFSHVDLKQIGADLLLESGFVRVQDQRLFSARFPIGIAFFSMENVRILSDTLTAKSGKNRVFGLVEFDKYMTSIYYAIGLPLERNPNSQTIRSVVALMNQKVVEDVLRAVAAKRVVRPYDIQRIHEHYLPKVPYNQVRDIDNTNYLVDLSRPPSTTRRFPPPLRQYQTRKENWIKKDQALYAPKRVPA